LEVVAVLDAEPVLEVLEALGEHHEVVLKDDCHAVVDHVGGEGVLGLLKGAGGRLKGTCAMRDAMPLSRDQTFHFILLSTLCLYMNWRIQVVNRELVA
jgi:hypothetical protein